MPLNKKFNSGREASSGVLRAAVLSALLLSLACEAGPPPFTEAQTLGGVSVPAEILNNGQKLFNRYCASCHGYEGKGDGPAARNLKPRDFQAAVFLYKSTPGDDLPTDADLGATIRNGKVDNGMPAWVGMRDEDIAALVSYIKTFSPRWRSAPKAP